jgi:prephenate dehydratase
MNLVAMPGQNLSDITEVHSHPMAILQCTEYFRKHPQIRIVETKDTALSAEEIADQNIMHRAALTSVYAAELFGLEVLAHSIETNKRNFTRFLALKRHDDDSLMPEVVNKSSISFRVKNIPGALAQTLHIFGQYNINLTKIQSLPVLGEEWTYYIHSDLEFEDYNTYKMAMAEATLLMDELIILGEYACGDKKDL